MFENSYNYLTFPLHWPYYVDTYEWFSESGLYYNASITLRKLIEDSYEEVEDGISYATVPIFTVEDSMKIIDGEDVRDDLAHSLIETFNKIKYGRDIE